MHPTFRRFGSAPIIAGLFCTLWLAGCATNDTGSTEEAAAPDGGMAPAEAAGGMPRAYFVNVEEGGTYPREFEVIFGVENFNIVPVEDPMVVRQGEGHYHLAYDVPCAPPGEVIVSGSPSYIHFGDGSDSITVTFEPGAHRLCLQVADGEHRVLAGPEYAGLTQEVRFTVAEQQSP